jgi:hypothetical protein
MLMKLVPLANEFISNYLNVEKEFYKEGKIPFNF